MVGGEAQLPPLYPRGRPKQFPCIPLAQHTHEVCSGSAPALDALLLTTTICTSPSQAATHPEHQDGDLPPQHSTAAEGKLCAPDFCLPTTGHHFSPPGADLATHSPPCPQPQIAKHPTSTAILTSFWGGENVSALRPHQDTVALSFEQKAARTFYFYASL